MAGNEEGENTENLNDDFEYLNKLLGVVVKRRKTFPEKCMELNKRKAYFELLRLENSNVVTEENNDKEIRKMIHKFKDQKFSNSVSDDLNEIKQKVEKCYERINEVHSYLEKRQMLQRR